MIGFYLILLGKLLNFKLINFNFYGSEYLEYLLRLSASGFAYIFTDPDMNPNIKISIRI